LIEKALRHQRERGREGERERGRWILIFVATTPRTVQFSIFSACN